MALFSFQNVTFGYEGNDDLVFENFSCELDSNWRLALVGRNGRGKTTLLGLLDGRLKPLSGVVQSPCACALFPYEVRDGRNDTRSVMRRLCPMAKDWEMERELRLLGVHPLALDRPYDTLSEGERTKVQLCALFAAREEYPLIDEPTNHLDLAGREAVAEYLAGKEGFLLVSHDRSFLNRCADHVLALGRREPTLLRGNFSTYEEELKLQTQFEKSRSEKLRREITRLEDSVRQSAQWSQQSEKAKFHTAPSECASVDRGYVGAKSARMMQRAKNTERRRQKALENTKGLLENAERTGQFRLHPLIHPQRELISVRDAEIRYGQHVVQTHVNLSVQRLERVALEGGNGAGKSSLLRSLCGLSDALTGRVHTAAGLKISYVPQAIEGLHGSLRGYIERSGVDETLFKAILRNFDVGREQFDKDLSTLSAGQQKKILLAKSLCESAHLYVWDEPLNYLDVFCRTQIEELLQDARPTLLVVEHDCSFLQRICTKTLKL